MLTFTTADVWPPQKVNWEILACIGPRIPLASYCCAYICCSGLTVDCDFSEREKLKVPYSGCRNFTADVRRPQK